MYIPAKPAPTTTTSEVAAPGACFLPETDCNAAIRTPQGFLLCWRQHSPQGAKAQETKKARQDRIFCHAECAHLMVRSLPRLGTTAPDRLASSAHFQIKNEQHQTPPPGVNT